MIQGGLSSTYAQCVDRFGRDGSGAIGLFAEREATLSADMKFVESRYLRAILIVDMWRGTNEHIIRLSRGEALCLRDALNVALSETKGDIAYGEKVVPQ